jgi:hypothetical protein
MSKPTICFDSLSQEQVAEAHAASVRTIRTWTRWGMPRNKDGTYSVSATWKWRQKVSERHYGFTVSHSLARRMAAQRSGL